MIRRILGLLLALCFISGAACSGESAVPEAPGTEEIGFEVTDVDFPEPPLLLAKQMVVVMVFPSAMILP